MDPGMQALLAHLTTLTTALQVQTQAVHTAPAPAPITAQINPDTGARPSAYKGKRGADAQRFILQLELYFADHMPQYPSHLQQIRYALSLCIEDAAEWANPVIRDFLDPHTGQPAVAATTTTPALPAGPVVAASWGDFKQVFLSFFGPQDKEAVAMQKIVHLWQGQGSMADYVTKFLILANQTKMSNLDKCTRLAEHMSPRLRLQLNMLNRPIDTLHEFV